MGKLERTANSVTCWGHGAHTWGGILDARGDMQPCAQAHARAHIAARDVLPGLASPFLDQCREALQQHRHDRRVEVRPDWCSLQIHLVLYAHRRLLGFLGLRGGVDPCGRRRAHTHTHTHTSRASMHRGIEWGAITEAARYHTVQAAPTRSTPACALRSSPAHPSTHLLWLVGARASLPWLHRLRVLLRWRRLTRVHACERGRAEMSRGSARGQREVAPRAEGRRPHSRGGVSLSCWPTARRRQVNLVTSYGMFVRGIRPHVSQSLRSPGQLEASRGWHGGSRRRRLRTGR